MNAIATVSLNSSLPARLAAAIEDRGTGVFGPNGFDLRSQPWTPPAVVTPELRTDASAALPAALAALELASYEDATLWLATLGTLVAGNVSAGDAAMKLNAYVSMLDMPAGLLTREMLGKAGRRFRFFPSFGELADFVDEERRRLEAVAQRLSLLVQGSAGQSERRNGINPIGVAACLNRFT